MKVINNAKLTYIAAQWCPSFVKRVFSSLHLQVSGKEVDTVELVAMNDDYIEVSIFDCPLTIRLGNFIPSGKDINRMVCGGKLEYALFIGEPNPDALTTEHRYPMTSGVLKIKWQNDPANKLAVTQKLHGAI